MEKLPVGIILFGKASCGKTTSLMKLAVMLASGGEVSPAVKKAVDAEFKIDEKHYKDARFIVEYKGKLAYIGTGGDTWYVCRLNCDFFSGNYNNLTDIYLIDENGVRKLDNETKNSYKGRTPDVCVSACRPEGDGKGAVKAIHSYSEDAIMGYSRQIWVHCMDKEHETQAQELLEIIDRHIDM